MTHPTDPVAAMREACARLVAGRGNAASDSLAAAIRALPLPAAQPDPRDEALRLAREAMEIIAGKRQCLDNLMGNTDVALAALAAIDALKE